MQTLAVYPKIDMKIRKASGVKLETESGQVVTDFYSGHGVISIGHSHPHFVKRLKDQLDTFAYYSNLVPLTEQDELCRALGELSGAPDYNIFLSNSGAEAIENALKIASTLTGRTKVVAMKGSFHGRTSLASQITDASKLCAPINQGLEVSFIALGDADAAREHIDNRTAAVVIEGIQGVGGIFEGDSAFWQTLAQLCESTGAMLIADEIQSGMGRTGEFFAFQHHGVKPHVICTAKGLGNGFPVAATWLRDDLTMPMGSLGSTFGGGPLACRAALAVCEVIAQEKLQTNAAVLGSFLLENLAKIPGVSHVRGRGLMLAFDVDGPAEAFRTALLEEGGIITGSASIKSTVRLLPPLSVSRRDCESLLAQIPVALKKVGLQ